MYNFQQRPIGRETEPRMSQELATLDGAWLARLLRSAYPGCAWPLEHDRQKAG